MVLFSSGSRRARLGALALGALAPFAAVSCSPDERVNPVPVDAGTDAEATSSSSSTTGSGGAGGMGGAATASSGSGAQGGAGGAGGMGGAASASSTSSTGGSGGSGGAGGQGGAMDGGAPGDGSVSCEVLLQNPPVLASPHVVQCSVVTYPTNPPTSGPHYPQWANFQTFTQPVPRGFLVHAMEHGAVVIGYHCEGGCDAEVAQIQALIDARPADPGCKAPLRTRVILVPDPTLDTRFAAAAWGALYKNDCLDLPSLGAFIDAHYAKGPENICSAGIDPTAPGSGIPGNCGQ